MPWPRQWRSTCYMVTCRPQLDESRMEAASAQWSWAMDCLGIRYDESQDISGELPELYEPF